MSTKIYNAYKVCDNKIETVFKIKKKLEVLYADMVYEYLDHFGGVTLKDTLQIYPKKYVFWDVINRYVLYKAKKYKEDDEKKMNTPFNKMFYTDLRYVLKAFIKQGVFHPLNFSASMVLIEYEDSMYVQFFGLYPHCSEYFETLETTANKRIFPGWCALQT